MLVLPVVLLLSLEYQLESGSRSLNILQVSEYIQLAEWTRTKALWAILLFGLHSHNPNSSEYWFGLCISGKDDERLRILVGGFFGLAEVFSELDVVSLSELVQYNGELPFSSLLFRFL